MESPSRNIRHYPEPRRRSPYREGRSRGSNSTYGRRFGSDQELKNSKSVFVGNLSYNIREAELREYMEQCGPVKTVSVGTSHTGQSKGYGFVEFEERRDAEEAILKYDGLDIDGRKLRLDWDIGIEKKMGNPAYRARRQPKNRRPRSRSSSPRRRRYSLSPRRSRSPPRYKRYYSPSDSISPRKRSRDYRDH